ncbi:hypothetical protein Pyn_19697 [Prunus yedoensis var. nudiflora]|uniref:Uncharacterized protein n=1 Tax=Prunus yedoensis var. nudiflora TaxID=2094558 RepID=A0A314Z901_PRUYE|nr:hypothetical protein Pyn_19697 [Prunus yedoensis var. nudiflora]
MNCVSLFAPRVIQKISCYVVVAKKLTDGCFGGNKVGSGNEFIEEPLKRIWRSSDLDSMLDEKENVYEYENHPREYFSLRRSSRMRRFISQGFLKFFNKMALGLIRKRLWMSCI